MRVAIYICVSHNSGTDIVDDQILRMKKMISAEGWKVAGVYQDRATSKRDPRKELNRMRTDAAAHRFDMLLFWALDRLSAAGHLAALPLLETLATHCIAFRSYSEPVFDSRRIFLSALTAMVNRFAQRRHAYLSERTKAGLAINRELGGPGSGRPKTKFDTALAIRMRAQKPPASYQQIADAVSTPGSRISKAVVFRFLRDRDTAARKMSAGSERRQYQAAS